MAMTVTGHQTRAVFRSPSHYAVSPGDRQEAARELAGTF